MINKYRSGENPIKPNKTQWYRALSGVILQLLLMWLSSSNGYMGIGRRSEPVSSKSKQLIHLPGRFFLFFFKWGSECWSTSKWMGQNMSKPISTIPSLVFFTSPSFGSIGSARIDLTVNKLSSVVSLAALGRLRFACFATNEITSLEACPRCRGRGCGVSTATGGMFQLVVTTCYKDVAI